MRLAGFEPYAAYTYDNEGTMTSMSYFGVTETRQYNTLRQLTNITVPGQINMTYTFPSGTNNGKISSQHDAISGETVTYAYDSLNRLLSASGSGWSDTYGYDGFGNLTTKSLLNLADNFSDNSITYNAFGPNSNSFTHSLLDAGGIPVPWWINTSVSYLLGVPLPGWGTRVPF